MSYKIIKGKHNEAKVFTSNVEPIAISQIESICNEPSFSDSKIRIMPDCHAGKGCVIGTTMVLTDKVVPNLVGADIGCGMFTVNLGNINLNLSQIDEYINNNIPHGFNSNEESVTNNEDLIEHLKCLKYLKGDSTKFNLALGTLGGGNHFIEINESKNGDKYLVVHSGSRNLGNQVARYYQDEAFKYHQSLNSTFQKDKIDLIKEYKEKGLQSKIEEGLKKLMTSSNKESIIPKELQYLEGQLMVDYLHDMNVVQSYAEVNREVIAKRIVEKGMGIRTDMMEVFHTIHNYIDLDKMILRKGAVSSQSGELILIPINMKEGSILARGKGNGDWNCSSPHGAGRLMSRTEAHNTLNLKEFKEQMKDIHSTSVGEQTLDESPNAYKPIEEILENTKDTIEVLEILKPIYNFKSH